MSIRSFLKQRAVEVVVSGNYVLPNWYDQSGKLRNFACRTSRVSPFRMIVDVPVVGRIGDTVSCYFADFGKLSGAIADADAESFLIEMSMTAENRRKISDQLTWLEKKQKDPSAKDARKDARIIPVVPHSTITLADGSFHRCFVINVSVSGVAVSADLQPPVGTPLAVGACVGRVVRTLPDGFAVRFVELQKRHEVERLVTRRGLNLDLDVDGPRRVA
ncbi:PilZ domain-containing protein [Bradyrhizobium erythrophlei]|uniref:PilZ domain-containing protein n=1 Tax=Bradyrhizobium erythrophlei TaxID=1437360 RepID=UPI0035ECA1FA